MSDKQKAHFIIEFIRADGIPLIDKASKCNPYFVAYLSSRVSNCSFERIATVRSPTRSDCSTAIWNCFRDFNVMPDAEAILTVEIYHHQVEIHKTDVQLGKVDVSVQSLADGEIKVLELMNFKVAVIINFRYLAKSEIILFY